MYTIEGSLSAICDVFDVKGADKLGLMDEKVFLSTVQQEEFSCWVKIAPF
tara:strand:+ start:6662 stop:6811 length:150 start_codon:yes stop_codon:yes gene_type:complete